MSAPFCIVDCNIIAVNVSNSQTIQCVAFVCTEAEPYSIIILCGCLLVLYGDSSMLSVFNIDSVELVLLDQPDSESKSFIIRNSVSPE